MYAPTALNSADGLNIALGLASSSTYTSFDLVINYNIVSILFQSNILLKPERYSYLLAGSTSNINFSIV